MHGSMVTGIFDGAWAHQLLEMGETHATKAKVLKKQIFLSSSDVLVRFISDGKVGGAMAVAGRTRRWRRR
jgi:hypothetical protein